MALGDKIGLDPDGSDSSRLCEEFWRLDQIRLDLDRKMDALSEADQGRDLICLDLEQVLRQVADIVTHLSAKTSVVPGDLRAKASVLANLLQAAKGDPGSLTPETFALIVSLTDEIAGPN